MVDRIHPLSNFPTQAWESLSKSQKVVRIGVKTPRLPVPPDKVRVVCMSDTHTLTSQLKFDIPDGDIFIHAGDFTFCGSPKEIETFNQWVGKLPHKHKLVIAGNHELSFDRTFTHPLSAHAPKLEEQDEFFHDGVPCLGFPRHLINQAVTCENAKSLLTNVTYLEDSGVQIYGLNFYGTPWQPVHHKWAFNLPRGAACLEKWDLIPDNTDILVTHTPPIGHGDYCCTKVRAGCVELLHTVQTRVKPRYHVFGHIHEAYGVTSDGKIIYVNASTCDVSYLPSNPPIVFDIPLPDGFTKA